MLSLRRIVRTRKVGQAYAEKAFAVGLASGHDRGVVDRLDVALGIDTDHTTGVARESFFDRMASRIAQGLLEEFHT